MEKKPQGNGVYIYIRDRSAFLRYREGMRSSSEQFRKTLAFRPWTSISTTFSFADRTAALDEPWPGMLAAAPL